MLRNCSAVNLADFEQMVNNFVQLGAEWFNDNNFFQGVKKNWNNFCIMFLIVCTKNNKKL